MPLPLTSLLDNALGAFREFFGYRREQAARENTPEMQAAARGSTDQDLKDSARKAIQQHNAEEIARRISQ